MTGDTEGPFDRSPPALFFRYVLQERLRQIFPPGARVLALGQGTGEEALFLAGRGVAVQAAGSAEDVAKLGTVFDGAYASFGALDRADLSAAGRALYVSLRPGAPVLLSLTRGRALSARAIRKQLGPGFRWRDAFALGVVLPAPSSGGWAQRNPQAFGLLAILERLVRRWPLVRSRGEYMVVEAIRT